MSKLLNFPINPATLAEINDQGATNIEIIVEEEVNPETGEKEYEVIARASFADKADVDFTICPKPCTKVNLYL